jgi:sugar-specific transcriptional regulator TrmB
VKEGKVLGFAAYTPEERLKDKEIEIDRKLTDLNKLRDELERFRRG